ncbi:MAG: universal stress protein [Pseudomonadota bacterium]
MTYFEVLVGDEAVFQERGDSSLILVATNGSLSGDLAVRSAYTLAKQRGVLLRVETIFDYELTADERRAFLAKFKQSTLNACADLEVPVAISASSLPDHFHNEEYGRAEMLLKAAKESGAGLIVIGPHKGSRPVFGTMTEYLLRKVCLPVLIAANPLGAYENVLVGVDFSDYSLRAIDTACFWAPLANVHLVHAFQPKLGEFQSESGEADRKDECRHRLEAMTQYQAGAGCEKGASTPKSLSAIVKSGAPELVIRQALKDIGANLLVLGARGQSDIADALFGGVATSFATNPPCDVILVKTN